jgi:hypothetical protein
MAYSNYRKNKINSLLLIFSLLAVFITVNSGCPHKHIQTYSPIIPGSVSGTVRTFDGETTAGAVVFIAADDLLKNAVKSKTLDAGGGFSFDGVEPGFYYIAAYKDMKNDGTYTIGEDYLGGKLIDQWDLDNSYHIEVKEAQGKVIDVPLLSTLKLNYIQNGTNSIELNPVFSWTAVSGAAFYRLRITSRQKSYWIIDTPAVSKTYGTDPAPGDTLITRPEQLTPELEYFWSITAFKEKGVPIAYSELARFYTRLLRTDKFGRIEILQ